MSSTSMGRRDFFLLKTKGRLRVLELSCERLYMRWADARSGAGAAGMDDGDVDDLQSWDGEPPTEIVTMTSDDLLEELDRELARADVLHVLGPDWLSDSEFRRDVESRVEAFRARGGRVE
jgi:hypothetical protein